MDITFTIDLFVGDVRLARKTISIFTDIGMEPNGRILIGVFKQSAYSAFAQSSFISIGETFL
ncbi:MAG: hypothetical protein OSB19_02510 [Opitutaceae bacterium]|nr:hypothetical protein [Opitutaceae bacterium]